jgi:hypothetical protein
MRLRGDVSGAENVTSDTFCLEMSMKIDTVSDQIFECQKFSPG